MTVERPGPGLPPSRQRLRVSRAPEHRRRQAAALATLVTLAVLVVLAFAGGGSAARRHADRHHAIASPRSRRRGSPPAGGRRVADIAAAENAAITRTLAYTPFVRIAGSQHRELALTFDDGPGPYTPEVLDVLERLHVPGTFFEVGIEERYFHDSTSRIVRDGFPIGDHTETHPPMSELSPGDQAQQLLAQTRAIGQYGAPFPRLFRPPFALWDHATLALLRRYRMLMVLWTVDTDDYLQPGVDAIVRSAVRGARPGAIILLHDAGGPRSETVAALPEIIHDLRARGYRLVSVPRLLLDNPAPRDQDIVGLTGDG